MRASEDNTAIDEAPPRSELRSGNAARLRDTGHSKFILAGSEDSPVNEGNPMGPMPYLSSARALAALGGALLITMACEFAHGDDVADLLPFVPDDANAISLMRIDALKSSPLGLARNWAERHETDFLEGAVTVPPWVSTLIRASYLRPGTPGGAWTVVLVSLPEDHDMQILAEREGTEVQEIDERPAVLSPESNGYFIELTPRVLGGMMPATRQDVARWADEATEANRQSGLSPYLVAAADDDSAQIVMAFDIKHMLDPATIRYRLNGADVLDGQDRAKAELTILFQTLRGLRFDVRVGDSMVAEIHMDFGRHIGAEGQFIKTLLVEFLQDAGAILDEVYDARVEVSGRSATLSMPLSDESLRRVLTLITTPPPPSELMAEVETTPETSPDESRADFFSTRRYWEAINRDVDDLRHAYGRSSYARTALWHEKFANRIDSLPTRGVDEEMVEYGQRVAEAFRGLSSSLWGTAVEVNALGRTTVYQFHPTSWWETGLRAGTWSFGGNFTPNAGYVTSNLKVVREQQAEAASRTAPQRQEIWRMLEQDRIDTERRMIARYGEEFRR